MEFQTATPSASVDDPDVSKRRLYRIYQVLRGDDNGPENDVECF